MMDLVDFEYQGLVFTLEFEGCWVCHPNNRVAMMLKFEDHGYEADLFFDDKSLIKTGRFETAERAVETLFDKLDPIWGCKPETNK